ncbi:MAG: hypothetical protein IT364_16680 [Candidatus Hydrogenedentes bacterium]|nr:hypothetical protein [Candidatus Hydrogenedentota bacterium]
MATVEPHRLIQTAIQPIPRTTEPEAAAQAPITRRPFPLATAMVAMELLAISSLNGSQNLRLDHHKEQSHESF